MLRRLWDAIFLDAEQYPTDEVLEARLKRKAKTKAKYIIGVCVFGISLFILGFLSKHAGIPDKVFALLIYLWLASLVSLFVFVPPWLSPRCTVCGKRTRKWLKEGFGGQDRIYFVCTRCKLKADTDIIEGD